MMDMPPLAAAVVVAMMAPHPVTANDLRALTPGSYQAGDCNNPSGAGYMSFDGANFSGNHQICRTTALGKARFRTVCMDTMGGGRTARDFDAATDKESFDLTIVPISDHAVKIGAQLYELCEPTK